MTLPPLVITTPGQDGLPFGPGYDIVGGMGSGPLPSDQYWEMLITGPPAQGEASQTINLTSRTLSFNERAYIPNGVPLVPTVTSQIPHGAVGNLTVRLRTSTLIIEQTSRPIVIDWQTGYQQIIALRQTGSGTAGFTEADRDVAAKTFALASFPLGGWLPSVIDVLSEITSIPYVYELITPDRTGGGVLTRPAFGQNVFAIGIRYQILEKPIGIGTDEGAPPSYELPLLELGITRDAPGTVEITVDSTWFRDQAGEWRWDFAFPFQVLYWLQPGVTARFWWIKLPGAMAS